MKTFIQKNRVKIFLSISFIWSLVWFTQKSLIINSFDSLSLGLYFIGIIPAVGLLIASIVAKNKTNNNISIFGKNQWLSSLIFVLPIVCLSIIGVNNSIGIQVNLFGFIIGIFTLTYALFEEIGWRGFLQEELMFKYNKWLTYAIVGLLWYAWHWYFLRNGGELNLIMIPVLIIASIGIGEVAKSTKSILICAALHGLVNVLLIYGVIANQISGNQKLLVLITCLIVWIPIIKKIEKINNIRNKVSV